jgi:hypothetical protein
MLVCRLGRWLHGCLVKSITDTLNEGGELGELEFEPHVDSGD